MSVITITLRGLAELCLKNLEKEPWFKDLPKFEGEVMDEFLKSLLVGAESFGVSGKDLEDFRNGKPISLSTEQLRLFTNS